MTLETLALQGNSTIYSSMAATVGSRIHEIRNSLIKDSFLDFQGMEHRLENVANIHGIEFINDSKATNVNAMRQALQAVPAGMVLIAGGRDKGNDYGTVTGLVREKVACIVAIGESRTKLVRAFDGIVRVVTAGTLREAVSEASRIAAPGSTVLFSPGCSSFDMFRDFEDRGEQFKQLVRELSS